MSLLETEDGRKAVAWALGLWAGVQRGNLPFTMGGRVSPYDSEQGAFVALNDPAKLAELIASEARRCGYTSWVNQDNDPEWIWDTVKRAQKDGADLAIIWSKYKGGWFVIKGIHGLDNRPNMSQARAFLAALLQLPDGARDAAERVLRGDSNG